MTYSATGFPPGTVYTITNITSANPGVVTVSSVSENGAFYLTNGMTITITNVKGMFQINRERFLLSALDTNALTFELYTIKGFPFDTSGFASYVSGGQVNIISYPPQAGSPPGLMYNTQQITI